jgi:hypothetical protein
VRNLQGGSEKPWCSGWKSLVEVSANGFIDWRNAQTGEAAKTLNEYQNAWNAFLKWSVRLNIIDSNPFTKRRD